MMQIHRLAAAVLAAGTLAAAGAGPLPAGTLITGGPGLLGLDSGYADVPGTGTTALSATDVEYISSDFALIIDFASDGSVTFYDNTGLGSLVGSYSYSFDFAGLPAAIGGFALGDVSGVTGGTLSASVVNGHAVSITLSDVNFSAAFGSFSAQVTTVPEPGTLALLAGSLALLWTTRARRAEG